MNNIAKTVLILGILNWSVFLITALLTRYPLGHIPGSAHLIIVLFSLLIILTIFSSLIGEVFALIVFFSKDTTLKWKIIILTINTTYLIIDIIILGILGSIGV